MPKGQMKHKKELPIVFQDELVVVANRQQALIWVSGGEGRTRQPEQLDGIVSHHEQKVE